MDEVQSKELFDYIEKYKTDLKEKRDNKIALKKLKRSFTLDEATIKSILDNRIIPKHRDISYEIYKAKYSNSFYIKLKYDKTYVTARLSDHDSKFNVPGKIVDDKTLKAQIVKLLEDRIIALKTKYKYFMISKYKEVRKPNEA